MRFEVPVDALGAHLGEALSMALNHAISKSGSVRSPFVRRLATEGGRLTVEAGVCVSKPLPGRGELKGGVLPKCKAACAIWQGAYETLAEGHRALAAWAEEAGHEQAGPPWEIHLSGPTDVSDPAATLSKLFLPVE